MKKNPYIDEKGRIWSYGEFLPFKFSSFAYNEAITARFFPKTKKQAINESLKWHEVENNKYTITKETKDLPDSITKIDDSILNEIIACSLCGKAYRFTLGELNLMKKLSLPLPYKCFNCRQDFRFSRINLPHFYNRECMKCNDSIKTSYAPNRSEIVYCEKCYQGEFL